MKRTVTLLLFVCALLPAAERRAKNVILFLGDAGGLATLNAASAYAHGEPQKLFIQSLPNIALSDTSPEGNWVTDSAAGMTAIVTGHKTHNGVISQGADTVRGVKDGMALKTILEYAEERGLSTGVLSNMNMTDATPAACYAHANDRKKSGEIFSDLLKPRFGDGVDVVIGNGRDAIFKAVTALGIDPEAAIKERGYELTYSPEEIPVKANRLIALFNGGDFDLSRAVNQAIDVLSRNRKGYFLMVEWDMHTPRIKQGLDRVIAMDNVIRETAGRVKDDTLILFTADHSFDLRLRSGKKGDPLFHTGGDGVEAKQPLRVDNSHTGEEVIAAAKGPGAERVRGFIRNTDLFHIMMAAYGWK
jgi:alkaline phosphatase